MKIAGSFGLSMEHDMTWRAIPQFFSSNFFRTYVLPISNIWRHRAKQWDAVPGTHRSFYHVHELWGCDSTLTHRYSASTGDRQYVFPVQFSWSSSTCDSWNVGLQFLTIGQGEYLEIRLSSFFNFPFLSKNVDCSHKLYISVSSQRLI